MKWPLVQDSLWHYNRVIQGLLTSSMYSRFLFSLCLYSFSSFLWCLLKNKDSKLELSEDLTIPLLQCILQKLFTLLNNHFIYLNQIFMYMPAWRKKNGKTDKNMLGKLQESSLDVCLKSPISENFPLSKTTYF